jgi:von Willebrand factor type A domain
VSGMAAMWRAIAVVAIVFLCAVVAPPTAVKAAALNRAVVTGSTSVSSGPLSVLDVVLLLDESGSMTDSELANEKEAAGTIVQSMLDPQSRVTVIGFGGVNNVAPDQVPTDVICVPTIASGPANLAYLATCISKLHRRTEAEGDDSDYAAGLGEAMSFLSPASTATPPSPAGATKIILMMTDAPADVHRDTQQYGADWQLGEQTAINEQLTAARADRVQLWPVGFGNILSPNLEAQAFAYLNFMAANAAPSVCSNGQPRAVWGNSPDDAIGLFASVYANATCNGTNSSSASLSGGQSVTLTVATPEIASTAAISVIRGNPEVAVTFYAPDGRQWTDSSAISGQASLAVVLHLDDITAAEVGIWRIGFTSPTGLATQTVTAATFWQGAVRAFITANPSNVNLGQPVTVTLDVLGPNGPITDPATAKDLIVAVAVTGADLTRPTYVPIVPVSRSPGEYEGTFAAPRSAGILTFTGLVSGNGLFVTQIPTTVEVGALTQGFTAIPELIGQATVESGGSIAGRVIFTNQAGSARRVRLVLSPTGADVSLSSPNGPITVPPGAPRTVPFTVTVARDAPAGPALIRVEVIDAATSKVYATAEQALTVTRPPGFIAQWWPLLVGLIALIAAVAAGTVWRRVVRVRRVNFHGLVAVLRRNDDELDVLKAPDKPSSTFRFIIRNVRDDEEETSRLDHPAPGFAQYTVKRVGPRKVLLTAPTGENSEMIIDGYGKEVGHNGLILAFRDIRSRMPRTRTGARRSDQASPGSDPRLFGEP